MSTASLPIPRHDLGAHAPTRTPLQRAARAAPPAACGVQRRYPNRDLINALADRHAQEVILCWHRDGRVGAVERDQRDELDQIRDTMTVADWRQFDAVYQREKGRVSLRRQGQLQAARGSHEYRQMKALLIGGLVLMMVFQALGVLHAATDTPPPPAIAKAAASTR